MNRGRKRSADQVVIVLGHRDPANTSTHLISDHTRHRVMRAQTVARANNLRAVLFTGWSATGPPSEARQMRDIWTGPKVPLLLEERSRSTAENAANCLPMVLHLAQVQRVTVVSCSWHWRTRYMFAPYRKFGVHVTVLSSHDTPREVLSNVWHEFRCFPEMRRVRAAAYARVGVDARTGSHLS